MKVKTLELLVKTVLQRNLLKHRFSQINSSCDQLYSCMLFLIVSSRRQYCIYRIMQHAKWGTFGRRWVSHHLMHLFFQRRYLSVHCFYPKYSGTITANHSCPKQSVLLPIDMSENDEWVANSLDLDQIPHFAREITFETFYLLHLHPSNTIPFSK